MNPILEYITGMGALTDQVIAMDLLINAKSGVRNYAMAVTECASPEIRAVLTKQLNEAIDAHERIATYMIEHGLYQPFDVQKQLQLNLQNMQTALNMTT